MEVNLDFTDADFARASEIRQEQRERLNHEPVFDSARKTLDKAERHQPRPTSVEQVDAVARSRDAMGALRKNLGGVHSTGASFFNETVPASPGESAVRGLVESDVANPTVAIGGPGTSISVELRPQNQASFESARATFLAGTPFEIKADGDAAAAGEEGDDGKEEPAPKPQVAFKMQLSLADGASDSDINEFVDFLKKMTGGMSRGSEKVQFEVTPLTGVPGKKALTVFAISTKDRRDPLEQFVKQASKVAAMRSGGGRRSNFQEGAAPPELFRLATARIEFPQAIPDFLDKGSGASWITFLEGLRVAYQIILRDHTRALMHVDIAKNILARFRAKNMAKQTTAAAAVTLLREMSAHVKIAPPEMLFGAAVREVAEMWRAVDPSLGKDSDADDDDDAKDAAPTNAIENLVATVIGSALKLGMTPAAALMGIPVIVAEKICDGRVPPFFDTILKLLQVLDSVHSVELLGKSAKLDVAFTGYKIAEIYKRLVGETAQEVVDRAKPFALAANVNWKEDDDSTKPEKLDSEMCSLTTTDFYPARDSFWFDEVTAVTEQLVKPSLARDSLRGSNIVSVIERPVKSTEDGSAAAFDFGIGGGGGAMKPALGMKTQDDTQDSVGVVTVKCDACGCEYNAALPGGHECSGPGATATVEYESSPSKRVGGSGVAAVKALRDEPKGVNMITCDICGDTYNACLPGGHQCVTAAPPMQTVEMESGPSKPLPVSPSPVHAGGAGGELVEVSESPRRESVGGSRGGLSPFVPRPPPRDQKKDRFFSRLGGTFQIPTDDDSLRKIFDSFDANKDGKVSKDEFAAEWKDFQQALGVPCTDSDVARAFKSIDKNRDGTLSYRELSRFLVGQAAK